MNKYNGTNKPSKDGNYLVKFYNPNMPEYDCTELVWRTFENGKWDNPIYNYEGDGYELVGWYENNEQEDCDINEHPVWSILNKEKYVEEFYPQAESMYDFIKSIVNICGNTIKDGNTVPTMQIFFDMWNEFSSETFWILDSLVNRDR